MAKVTMKELTAAYKELDEKMDLDPKINFKKMDQEEFEKELFDTIDELLEPEDKFSKSTQAVWDYLNKKYKEEDEDEEEDEEEEEEEEPAKPVKGKGKAPAKPEPSAKEKGKKQPEPEEEDEEEEEDEKPAKKKTESKKGKKVGGPGIIASIAKYIEEAGKKGISKEEILKKLKKDFPEREEASMKNTINVQVPNRMSKERFAIKKLENGNFAKK